jgi:hypothetical protein
MVQLFYFIIKYIIIIILLFSFFNVYVKKSISGELFTR